MKLDVLDCESLHIHSVEMCFLFFLVSALLRRSPLGHRIYIMFYSNRLAIALYINLSCCCRHATVKSLDSFSLSLYWLAIKVPFKQIEIHTNVYIFGVHLVSVLAIKSRVEICRKRHQVGPIK